VAAAPMLSGSAPAYADKIPMAEASNMAHRTAI
jgi:hypothetical protein